MKANYFKELNDIFNKNGYSLFLVGGAVRDYLLNIKSNDLDFVTDATPKEISNFYQDIDLSFSRYGSVRLYYKNQMFEITTLRKEKYLKARIPNSIEYVKNIKDDSIRRDFTINAIYMDTNFKIFDFHNGISDLQNKTIRIIGEPKLRIEEDPLRILRAIRFAYQLNFKIEEKLDDVIKNNIHLLKKVSNIQINKELMKIKELSLNSFKKIVTEYSLDNYIAIEENKVNDIEVVDLHCDTLTVLFDSNLSILKNDKHIDINKLIKGHYRMQCFAVFINLSKPHPYERCLEYISFYKKMLDENSNILQSVVNVNDYYQLKNNLKIGAMLTIEEGGVLQGKIERLEELYNLGVRMMTLTWNYPNEIGYSNYHQGISFYEQVADEEHGLTEFGKEVVKKMNELGMIIDVSHLSDKGFYDVLKITNAPIVASHSNSRTIHNCIRNLSDEMILALHKNHGVMGINYCPDFVSFNKENQISDIVKHILHIRSLGCLDVVALGSDFDGIPTPNGLKDASFLPILEKELINNGLSKEEVKQIFYKNFIRVMKKVVK